MGMMMRGSMKGPSRPLKRETLVRIARSFAPYKLQLFWTAIAVLASAGLGLLSPFFLRIIINRGLLRHDMSVISRYTIYTILATLGGTGLALGFGYLSSIVGQRIMRDLRMNLL